MSTSLPATNNSLTQFLTQLLRIQKNSMEIVGVLSDITTGNAPTLSINLQDVTGATQSYELPSIGYLEQQINRIDDNFNKLSGLDGGDVLVRLPDGSFKKLIHSSLFNVPGIIGQLNIPTTFNSKNNWFFERFLNPTLYVSFDITNYIDIDTEKISYRRFILNLSTNAQIQYFNSNYNNTNNIDYNSLITNLNAQGISYFIDDDILNLPVSIPRFSGSFDVISFNDVSITSTQTNGSIITSTVRKYQLNTLKYTDNLQNYLNTQILKSGDVLSCGKATTYIVNTVDTSTNMITVTMTVGTETIPIGASVLSIQEQAFAIKEAQINIGFNEYQIIFVKAIDKSSNMTTPQFSPGVGFYSNNLNINTSTGTVSLTDYYNQEVMDFGTALLSLTKEGIIPSVYGLKPDPPTLNASNFQVLLINSQKTDTQIINTLQSNIAQKNSLASEISQLDASIANLRQTLNTTVYTSTAAQQTVENQLNTLIQQRTSASNLYNSIIQTLTTTAKNLPPELSDAKYHIRGFFPFPGAKTASNTRNQEVIGFIISYRYLSSTGVVPATEQINFTDSSGNVSTAYFSNWIEYPSKIRSKVYDSTQGIYVWATEDLTNSDVINPNQIDIPISNGEEVEIRIKSVSEVGWPVNPLVSDWSQSVIISFPASLSSSEEILASLSSVINEQSRINFNSDLTSRGLDNHLASSFTKSNNYYAHSASDIATGFFDNAGNIIDLYDMINTLNTQIATLQAIVNKTLGVLQVYVVDTDGTSYAVTNNSVIQLFAGYYSNLVAALPAANQKGAIITNTYKIVLTNSELTPLQLVSRYPGGIDVGLPGTQTNDLDYAISRQYVNVPISLSSMSAASTSNSKPYQAPPFQSAQQCSQFLYMRYTDIGLLNPLYGPVGTDIQSNTYYPDSVGSTSAPFVWNFSNGTGYDTSGQPLGAGSFTSLGIHILHPLLYDGSLRTLDAFNKPVGASTSSPSVYPQFTHSSYFDAQTSDINGKIQLQYIPTIIDPTVPANNYPAKLGFYANDRYLLGPSSCGSYLYLAPSTYSTLLVNGTDYLATTTLLNGTSNQIVIPVIYQFRMTDFYGNGVGGGKSGLGNVGGFSIPPANLSYTKRIGIDITVQNTSVFSFDIEVNAKYTADSPSQTSISPAQKTLISSAQTTLVNNIF